MRHLQTSRDTSAEKPSTDDRGTRACDALAWGITIVVILGLFVFDFFAHVRTPHAPTFRESAFWSTVYISIASSSASS